MRILLTIHHDLERNSGASGTVVAIRNALSAKGYQVDVLSHDDLPKWAKGRRSLFTFPAMVAWRALRDRHRYEVLDFASSDGWMATMLPRALRPRVLAFRSHGLEHIEHLRFEEDCHRRVQQMSWKYRMFRGSIYLHLIALAARHADVTFFLNRHERDFAVKSLRVRCDRASVVGHGLNVSFLNRSLPSPPDAGEALNIAFIGNYIALKGIAHLIPALESHLRQHEAARVMLLGTGVAEQAVLSDITPDLWSRVRVVPRYERDVLPDLLKHCHLFVLPSLSEGFGKAALEAMSCGLVPIVTRGHGFDEFVEHEQNGLLIERGSTHSISEALDRLERDRPAWLRMRHAAIQTARTYTWDRAASARVAGYERAAAVSATPGVPGV